MLANLMSGLSLAFNNAKRSTLSSESHRGPEGEWVGLTLAASERNRRSSFEWRDREREREKERGLRCKSRGPEGPSFELCAGCRSGEGLEGAKAHSKAERLPVKVEGKNSLSRYCAPFLSTVASFLP